MVISILGILGGLVLFLLGILHFHWAFGGNFAFADTLPTNSAGERVLNPKKRDSAIVGLGLCAFSIIYLVKSGIITVQLPLIVINYGLWIIIAIFFLRSVGDFKYIGMFKKVKNTDFSSKDSRLYTPICISIALMGLIIEAMGNV